MVQSTGWVWTKAACNETVNTVMNASTNVSPSHTFPALVVGKNVYLTKFESCYNIILVLLYWMLDLRDKTVGEGFLKKVGYPFPNILMCFSMLRYNK